MKKNGSFAKPFNDPAEHSLRNIGSLNDVYFQVLYTNVNGVGRLREIVKTNPMYKRDVSLIDNTFYINVYRYKKELTTHIAHIHLMCVCNIEICILIRYTKYIVFYSIYSKISKA